MDHQAKIRGYRIETGEIESQSLKVDAVREAVVVVREDAGGQKALCAYFTAEGEPKISELRAMLSQEPPGYMIPSHFMQLERLPLTANGKVDRKAPPAPEGSDTGVEHIAPRTALEAKLARIWQEVLGQTKIGVKDNFFDLGGHSLRATTLVGKVHKELNVDLPRGRCSAARRSRRWPKRFTDWTHRSTSPYRRPRKGSIIRCPPHRSGCTLCSNRKARS
ncbi:phosphopantetheine-binding protein [Paenibacillus sp. P25]|nr:phosphopantetheine-binding protein [Paenibacillus sp. P25]